MPNQTVLDMLGPHWLWAFQAGPLDSYGLAASALEAAEGCCMDCEVTNVVVHHAHTAPLHREHLRSAWQNGNQVQRTLSWAIAQLSETHQEHQRSVGYSVQLAHHVSIRCEGLAPVNNYRIDIRKWPMTHAALSMHHWHCRHTF